MTFAILVVCLGNVCRSPMAERILRLRLGHLLGDRTEAVQLSSAGTRALVGHPMDRSSASELIRLGGDPRGFVSTQLTGQMVEAASLILTATVPLRSRVLEEAPTALKRTFTIREFAASASGSDQSDYPADLVAQAAKRRGTGRSNDYDIPDPIGQSAVIHRQVAEVMDRSCTVIARALAPTLLHDPR